VTGVEKVLAPSVRWHRRLLWRGVGNINTVVVECVVCATSQHDAHGFLFLTYFQHKYSFSRQMMEDSGIDSDPKQPTVSYFGDSTFAKVTIALDVRCANSIMQIARCISC
jgi:hypothetical protein